VGTSLSLLDARFQLLSQRVHEPLVEHRIVVSSGSVKLDSLFGQRRPAFLGINVVQKHRFFAQEKRDSPGIAAGPVGFGRGDVDVPDGQHSLRPLLGTGQ